MTLTGKQILAYLFDLAGTIPADARELCCMDKQHKKYFGKSKIILDFDTEIVLYSYHERKIKEAQKEVEEADSKF